MISIFIKVKRWLDVTNEKYAMSALDDFAKSLSYNLMLSNEHILKKYSSSTRKISKTLQQARVHFLIGFIIVLFNYSASSESTLGSILNQYY